MKSKLTKIIVWVVGILVALIVIASIIISIYAGSIISSKLKAYLAKNPIEPYEITFKNVRFNVFTSTFKINDLEIKPDTSILYDKERLLEKPLLVEISIPSFKLAGIGFYEILNNKAISLSEIIISDAEVRILQGRKVKTEEARNNAIADFNLHKISIHPLTSIELGKLRIENSSFVLKDLVANRNAISIDDFALVFSDFKISPHESGLHTEIEHGPLHIELNGFKKDPKDGGLYQVLFEQLELKTDRNELRVTNFHLNPIYSRTEFFEKIEYQKERSDVMIGELYSTTININELLDSLRLRCDKIDIRNMNVSLLRDKNVPIDSTVFPKFPNTLITSVEFPIKIDTLDIRKSKLTYEEIPEGKKEAGKVWLDPMDALIINASNHGVRTYTKLRMYVNSKLMGEAPIQARIYLPLFHRPDSIHFEVELGEAELSVFDPVLAPLAGISFKEGKLNKVSLTAEGNDNVARGVMTMLYTDLDANILKQKDEKERKIVSWFANTLAKSSNPLPGKPERTVSTVFVRDKYKGMVNFLWKTALNGIKNTVAPGKKYDLENETRKQEHKEMKREEKEEEKEIKKRERKEKREKRKKK